MEFVKFIVGMEETKHQSMFQPTEESGLERRALPGHDFCDSRLYITPSAYRFMSHEIKDVDGKSSKSIIKSTCFMPLMLIQYVYILKMFIKCLLCHDICIIYVTDGLALGF